MTAAELVERVAQALDDAAIDIAEGEFISKLKGEEKDNTPYWPSMDRAAIAEMLAAIREPTEAMREAGADSECVEPTPDGYTIYPSLAWRAMIDALAAEIREGM